MLLDQQVETNYNLYLFDPPQHTFSIPGIDLLVEEKFKALLNLFGVKIGSPSHEVTASLFVKRYSFLILTGPLFVMRAWNRPLDLSINYTTLYLDESLSFKLHLSEQASLSISRDAEHWRDRMIDLILYHNLTPVFNTLAKLTKITVKTLWSHTAFNLEWFYDRWLEEAPDSFFRIDGDYPLKESFKAIEHPLTPDHKLRLRNVCCLNHCLPNGNYCTTCPIINDEQRLERLIEYSLKKTR